MLCSINKYPNQFNLLGLFRKFKIVHRSTVYITTDDHVTLNLATKSKNLLMKLFFSSLCFYSHTNIQDGIIPDWIFD